LLARIYLSLTGEFLQLKELKTTFAQPWPYTFTMTLSHIQLSMRVLTVSDKAENL